MAGTVGERLEFGDLRIDPGQFAGQHAGGDRRRVHRGQPGQRGAPALPQRLDRRDVGIGGIEPVDGLLQVGEHERHLRAVETAGELVEAAAAAIGVERLQLMQFVEAEGHHGGERALVDIPHEILEEERSLRAAGNVEHRELIGHRHVAIGLVCRPRQPLQMRPLVPPLDDDLPAVDAGPGKQPAAAGQVRVEDSATKQAAKPEEHATDELKERGFAGFVGAVQHLDARAEPLDRDVAERAEPINFNPFDDHDKTSGCRWAVGSAGGFRLIRGVPARASRPRGRPESARFFPFRARVPPRPMRTRLRPPFWRRRRCE